MILLQLVRLEFPIAATAHDYRFSRNVDDHRLQICKTNTRLAASARNISDIIKSRSSPALSGKLTVFIPQLTANCHKRLKH